MPRTIQIIVEKIQEPVSPIVPSIKPSENRFMNLFNRIEGRRYKQINMPRISSMPMPKPLNAAGFCLPQDGQNFAS